MTCPVGMACSAVDAERSRPYECRPVPAAAPRAPTCKEQFTKLLEECTTQLESTAYSCDEKNDQGMSSVADSASQLALMMGQQTSASVQAACSGMANISQAANAAVAAYRINCSSEISTCKTVCSKAKAFVAANARCLGADGQHVLSAFNAQAEGEAKKCDAFTAKMEQANQAIQNYGNTSANASQCEELTSGDATPTPEFCAANPSYPSCTNLAAVDCNDPTMASTNKVCICAKTPNDPACFNAQKAGSTLSAQAGGLDASSRLNAEKGEGSLFDGADLGGLPSIAQGSFTPGGGEGVDGQQGSGNPVSGGSGGSAGGANSGEGSGGLEETSTDVNGGFYGGGGAQFGSGGSSGSGDGDRGVAAVGPGGAPGGPDLRKFLPGGQFDPRKGVSGMNGRDGITGPNSDIWQKVQNRYRVMAPSLLP
ncbi:hypothetical protein [Bdellovibrio reynosensis]|uniref:Uncharacterized protein n=1 Tax=Bdellovibrio reynosensis TaxID=2835041 RepID=A0ABY4C4Z6_9BACT|nr:hypothetical protein [Bdellovibrio reynosensis]UOE99927.1 hypothetical protein MNR06_09475 [Bdellovibrio reynosensis]